MFLKTLEKFNEHHHLLHEHGFRRKYSVSTNSKCRIARLAQRFPRLHSILFRLFSAILSYSQLSTEMALDLGGT